MDKKWEINRVSTPERIFDKINNEMAQPVGIILFGADCELKDDVLMECQRRVLNLAPGYGDVVSASIFCQLDAGRNIMIVMDGNMSGDHKQRHRIVTALRDHGAKTIVGIFAKYQPIWLGDKRTAEEDSTNEQAWALINRPPTADGLDYLLVVSEEKEG